MDALRRVVKDSLSGVLRIVRSDEPSSERVRMETRERLDAGVGQRLYCPLI